MFQDRLAVDDTRALFLQRPDHQRIGPVDGEDVCRAAVFPQRPVDLRRPALRHGFCVIGDQHVVEGDRRADVAHAFQPGAQMAAGCQIEQDRRAVRENQRVADDIVHRPDLHVPRAGSVAQVDRIDRQHRLAVPSVQFLPDTLRAVGADRRLVDGLDARGVVHCRIVVRTGAVSDRRHRCLRRPARRAARSWRSSRWSSGGSRRPGGPRAAP